MLYCESCGAHFEAPEKTYETHGLDYPPYERLNICPKCKSTDIKTKKSGHCRCCGAKISDAEKLYCSEACHVRGEKMWREQLRRRKESFESPLNKIIREAEEYNKNHGTDLSYGEYVAIIMPRSKGRKKNESR